ncbi:hypothetical protein FHS77_001840 [Paenochrobactrum gallinarii]|uniref:DUF1284 domain-containing protein n=1 Tax=Paenochrobactrum gallinarii TaxID=643673 RepID=A0A841M0B4_9HYPH|nr:DUF1284 domain-containing protein [Paenochrobactrum gallinarii]MBB6261289.1 hypothetical protein [Paenochrobactrum gallinarii]
MTIHLRGHHLLCMLTYIGKGYSPFFVENYDQIAEALSHGTVITLVNGPDDICAPLLCEENCHCHNASVILRDQAALEDISTLLGVRLQSGSKFILNSQLLQKLRAAFSQNTIRSACKGCQWAALCTDIAQNSAYRHVKIQCTDMV